MPHLRLVRREHTLMYAMRVLPGESLSAEEHPRVSVSVADGREISLVIHAITGDRETLRKRLLESIDAFFELHGEVLE